MGKTCAGQCCDEKTENQLRLNVQQEFASLLRHNSRSLQGLLSTTATTLHGKRFYYIFITLFKLFSA